MATDYENFMKAAVSVRSATLNFTNTGYDGDPNDLSAPDILKNAPAGEWFLQQTGNIWWRKPATGIYWECITRASRNGWVDQTITVDAVNGNDFEGNDGTTIPLRTFKAFVERLPTKMVNCEAIFKAGTYDLTDGYDTSGGYASVDTPMPIGLTIRGEWSTSPIASFTPISAVEQVIGKDTGTPAWTVDEFAGKVLGRSDGVGGYSPAAFINSNTAHEIVINTWAPFIGTTEDLYIIELTTIWQPSVAMYANFSGCTTWQYLALDMSAGGNYSFEGGLHTQQFLSVKNAGSAAIYYYSGASGVFAYSHLENLSGTDHVYAIKCNLLVMSLSIRNGSYPIRPNTYALIHAAGYFACHTVTPGYVFNVTYSGKLIFCGSNGDIYFHCTNVAGIIRVWHQGSSFEHINYTAAFSNSTTVTGIVLYLYPPTNNQRGFIGALWTMENTTTPANTFRANTRYFSLSDLRNKYKKMIVCEDNSVLSSG